MSFVAAGTFVVGAEAAATIGALGTGLIGGALVGAGSGALINGLTGRSVLNGALMGGLIGGAGGAAWGGIAGAGAISSEALATADAAAVQAGYPTAAYAMNVGNMSAASLGLPATTTAADLMASSAALTAPGATGAQVAGQIANTSGAVNTIDPMQASQEGYPLNPATPQAPVLNTKVPGANDTPSLFSGIGQFVKDHPYLTAAGVGAAALASSGKNAFQPTYLQNYTPQTASSVGLGRTLSAGYRPYIAKAEGGIVGLASGGLTAAGLTGLSPKQDASSQPITMDYIKGLASQYGVDIPQPTNPFAQKMAAGGQTDTLAGQPMEAPQTDFSDGNSMYPGSAQPNQRLDFASQMPQSAMAQTAGDPQTNPLTGEPIAHMASGGMAGNGHLGGYSDGGRLLKGPGDGMSDNIPASIAGKQPARLADGEFVVPADVVSHLGNGSTDAGAKHLYKMMDNVRKARTGRKAQGKQIKAGKYLPK